MSDPTAQINANKGGIQALLTNPDVSLWEYQGYDASNIFVVDDNAKAEFLGNAVATFNQTAIARLRKRGGRPFQTWLKLNIRNRAARDAGLQAAWVDDLGANLLEYVEVKYSSKDLQTYSGEALKFYQRLMDHDVTKEHYNALQLAGLPGVVGETVRSAYLSNVPNPLTTIDAAGNFQIWICLDWIWFTREARKAFTTEALSSEIEVKFKFRRIEELVYSRDAGGFPNNPWALTALPPQITEIELKHQLVFTPVTETTNHLERFESEEGLSFKVLDFSPQLGVELGNTAKVYPVKLPNLRLDSQFCFFVIRDTRINVPWAIDRTSSDITPTAFTGGGAVNACLPIVRFRVLSNGTLIKDWQSEQENRILMRKLYFPGSQINGFVYFFPWSQYLRDHANVHGYQNLTNLGSLEIEIELAAAPVGVLNRQCDCWSVDHNIIQQALGDIIRLQR